MGDHPDPHHDIGALARALEHAGDTIATHEASLAQALADQVRLTREVHHRVKNNLQVIASLISLHARGAPPGPVAEAYATIQRRVDALAIVHRNHLTEIDSDAGIGARVLVGELAANLRTGIAATGRAPPITVDVADLRMSQDIAAPVAFLITELTELSMISDRAAPIALTIADLGDGRALLSIASRGLMQSQGANPHNRILAGLARQLRAPLDFDSAHARYAIAIPLKDPRSAPQ